MKTVKVLSFWAFIEENKGRSKYKSEKTARVAWAKYRDKLVKSASV